MKRFIGFRLRKELDEDIFSALKEMDADNVADFCRLGLRMALDIKTQRVIEVREIPLQAAPKVWRPKGG